MSQTIAIIGAGITGLSIGCYARANRYRPTVFEARDEPGGAHAVLRRGAYAFSITPFPWTGARAGTALHRIWEELGAWPPAPVGSREILVRAGGPTAARLTIPGDPDRLRAELLRAAPGDAAWIDDYGRIVARLVDVDPLTAPVLQRADGRRTRRVLRRLRRWQAIPASAFAARCSHPLVRRALAALPCHVPTSDPSVLDQAIWTAAAARGDLGYPIEAPVPVARRIERRYLELGGETEYGTRIETVLVEDGRAVGVRTSGGIEHQADFVVSAADGHATIYRMLGGEHVDPPIDEYYRAAPERHPFGLSVHLGIADEIPGGPRGELLLLDEPLPLDAPSQETLYVEVHGPATGRAPAGRSVISAWAAASPARWSALRDRGPDAYGTEADHVAEAVIERIERFFPGIRPSIESVEVVTPTTIEARTGRYRGLSPWPVPDALRRWMEDGVSRRLPGIRGFQMAGPWAEGAAGPQIAALAGRRVVQALCREDGRRFRSPLPSARARAARRSPPGGVDPPEAG